MVALITLNLIPAGSSPLTKGACWLCAFLVSIWLWSLVLLLAQRVIA